MSRKRRVFDIDLPESEATPKTDLPEEYETKSAQPARRRGPMATAIGETGEALRRRKAIEAEIRAENDALAEEFVRLKGEGLVTDRIPVDAIDAKKLIRDRSASGDLELGELKASLQDIGLSNPIRVELREDGRYELIEGLRRLTAYRELLAETGEARWGKIPAGLLAAGQGEAALYRRMVDENLVRKDVSFAEMAALAMAYADAKVEGCETLDEAVNRLYASVSPQKRSYIRRFGSLLRRLGKRLEHPAAIPRAVGLELADRLEGEPTSITDLTARLENPGRSAEEEVAVLRDFLASRTAPLPKKGRGAPRATARRGRVALSVPVGPGVKCTATEGKVELRAGVDFSAIERVRLEAAIAAFFAALDE